MKSSPARIVVATAALLACGAVFGAVAALVAAAVAFTVTFGTPGEIFGDALQSIAQPRCGRGRPQDDGAGLGAECTVNSGNRSCD